MFGSILDSVGDFVASPIKTSIDIVTQPVVDIVDVLDGLTEGELRHKAALRLGADVASGLALNELIEMYKED